jgi:hypothetical protein
MVASIEGWKVNRALQVANMCSKVRFLCSGTVLWPSIENHTIIIKFFTICTTRVAILFPMVYSFE